MTTPAGAPGAPARTCPHLSTPACCLRARLRTAHGGGRADSHWQRPSGRRRKRLLFPGPRGQSQRRDGRPAVSGGSKAALASRPLSDVLAADDIKLLTVMERSAHVFGAAIFSSVLKKEMEMNLLFCSESRWGVGGWGPSRAFVPTSDTPVGLWLEGSQTQSTPSGEPAPLCLPPCRGASHTPIDLPLLS